MSEPTPPRHSARETRLLVITLAVSVFALLLLARFRFPERAIADLSPPQPLTRLTRVTAFDELSALLRDLLLQFEGAVVPVRVVPAASDASSAVASAGFAEGAQGASGAIATSSAAVAQPVDALALVVANDLALVPLPSGSRVVRVAGSPATADLIVARDDERGLAAVRIPGHTAPDLPVTPAATPVGAPGYVAILEAAPEGPTIRAEFVSRVSRESHPAWDAPVLALGGAIRAQPGAFLFTLNGRFIGMTLDDPDRTLVIPAEPLLARATRLTNGENVRLIDAGLGIQPLTPALAAATRATVGVVVNAVHATPSRPTSSATAASPPGAATNPSSAPATATGATSSATVDVGDVITAVNGQPIRSPREWQQALRARGPGATLDLTVVRLGKQLRAPWTLPRADASPSRPLSASDPGSGGGATATTTPADIINALGLSLRSASGASGARGVEIVDVRAATPAARAGLHVGDHITALPGRGPATQNTIATAYAELPQRSALLLAIDRQGAPLVAALEKP